MPKVIADEAKGHYHRRVWVEFDTAYIALIEAMAPRRLHFYFRSPGGQLDAPTAPG